MDKPSEQKAAINSKLPNEKLKGSELYGLIAEISSGLTSQTTRVAEWLAHQITEAGG